MIQAKDLRIGNWVYMHGKPEQVTSIYAGPHNTHGVEVSSNDYEGVYVLVEEKDIEGIPLTEEIMMKAGFEKHHYGYFKGEPALVYHKDGLFFNKSSDGFEIDFGDYFTEVMFLHQLQNLKFVIHGIELEIQL